MVNPRVWNNPMQPDTTAGPSPVCPRCGSPIVGPFASFDEHNHPTQKTACSNQRCTYVARVVFGFGTMKDADTLTFK